MVGNNCSTDPLPLQANPSFQPATGHSPVPVLCSLFRTDCKPASPPGLFHRSSHHHSRSVAPRPSHALHAQLKPKMPPTGRSFRNMMRGNSSSESSSMSDENEIQMQGWMRKQKETLRSWARRYFTLNGKMLTYYDSEDTSRGARGILEFVDVTALTTENNGLSLHLVNGKEVRLIADTHVAYAAWMAVLSAAVKKPRTTKNRTSKEGWAHCLTDDDVWTRFFVVIKHDSFSCYESEDDDAELALSGLIRAVDEWDGKRFGIVCSLNRGRTIKLCFDSAEEKMSWFLTLEFSVSYGSARMKKEASMKSNSSDHNPVLRADSSKSEVGAAAEEEDDGVWI